MMIKKLLVVGVALLPLMGFSQSIYKLPKMSFIQRGGETVTDIEFKNKSIEEVQAAIDKAHSQSDILRVTLSGSFTVTKAPLKLANKTILFLNTRIILALFIFIKQI